jgi:hypothetical protein
LHSTGQLVDLIQNATPWRRGSTLTILPLKFSCGFASYISHLNL